MHLGAFPAPGSIVGVLVSSVLGGNLGILGSVLGPDGILDDILGSLPPGGILAVHLGALATPEVFF